MPGEKTSNLLPPFKPGQSGNPEGRPRGARNKLTEAFISAVHDDFQENGKQAIEDMRTQDPGAYVRVVASLMPKHVEIKDLTLDEFEPADLATLLDAVRAARGAGEADREGALH